MSILLTKVEGGHMLDIDDISAFVDDADLADLSAACFSALCEQQEPTRSPVIFTMAEPVCRFGETSIEAQGDVGAFNRPKSAQCKCSLLDDASSLPPCGRYYPAIDGYDGLCITTLTEESLCGHDRACHAEGKSNETV